MFLILNKIKNESKNKFYFIIFIRKPKYYINTLNILYKYIKN